MTAPEYLDPVRHELHQLRADNNRLRAQLGVIGDAYKHHHKALPIAFIAEMQRGLIALADKEPTP